MVPGGSDTWLVSEKQDLARCRAECGDDVMLTRVSTCHRVVAYLSCSVGDVAKGLVLRAVTGNFIYTAYASFRLAAVRLRRCYLPKPYRGTCTDRPVQQEQSATHVWSCMLESSVGRGGQFCSGLAAGLVAQRLIFRLRSCSVQYSTVQYSAFPWWMGLFSVGRCASGLAGDT